MLDDPARVLVCVVQRAIDHMQAHADEPLTVASIARAVGVSVRTLQVSFQEALGVNPMRHLKAVRLRRVRSDSVTGPEILCTVILVAIQAIPQGSRSVASKAN